MGGQASSSGGLALTSEVEARPHPDLTHTSPGPSPGPHPNLTQTSPLAQGFTREACAEVVRRCRFCRFRSGQQLMRMQRKWDGVTVVLTLPLTLP